KWHLEDFCSCGGMDIPTSSEGFNHGFIPGESRHYPQFDLRIICSQQYMIFIPWDKSFANFPSPFCSDWNILKIWIDGRETSRSSYELIVCRVDSARFRIDQQWQCIYIRGFQLHHLAEIQNV